MGEPANPAITCHFACHQNFAQALLRPGDGFGPEPGFLFDFGLFLGLGVVIDIGRFQIGNARFQIQGFNQVRSAFVQVDCIGMHHPIGAVQVHLANGFLTRFTFQHEADLVRGGVAQGDVCRRVLIRHPEEAIRLLV